MNALKSNEMEQWNISNQAKEDIIMWKKTPVDNNYEASNDGQIREINTGKLISQWLDKDGYLMATLSGKLYRVHRLIAITFINNPKNLPVVNHKNFNKSDNHVANLEWVTYSENSKHSFTGNHRGKTIKDWVKKVQFLGAEASKTKVAQYDLQNNLLNVYNSQREASEKTGTCRSSITQCVNGKRKTAGGYKWKYYLEGSTTKNEENPTSSVRDSEKSDEDIV